MEQDNYIKLFRKGRNGNTNLWEIWNQGGTITLKSRQKETDSPLVHTELVEKGKAGRSLAQQVKSRIDARVSSKMDGGYVHNLCDVKSELTNTMGFYRPMLASKYRDVKKTLNLNNCYVQQKFDGHRLLTNCYGGNYTPYTRAGKEVKTVEHIMDQLNFHEDVTLDGEMYVHGQSLQTIASWVKRKQPNSDRLVYMIYDCMLKGASYEERLEFLRYHIKPGCNVQLSTTLHMRQDNINLSLAHKKVVADGYEGLILREQSSLYEIGRRSKSLIKVKALEDSEFQVIDVVPSREGWGILICEIHPGLTFRLSAPGQRHEKYYVIENKHLFIGRFITAEYPGWTLDGKPFHAVALRWRADL
jgi:DNA ligase-1